MYVKLDLTTHRVENMATFSPLRSVSDSLYDNKYVDHNILCGDSMSCTFIVEVVAYVIPLIK